VTQQIAALVEEAAAAAESLKDQAGALSLAVAAFTLSREAEASATPIPVVERRGPNRANNVERLPVKTAAPSAPSSANTGGKKLAVAGGDGEWEEF
jgi:hypothetical protein